MRSGQLIEFLQPEGISNHDSRFLAGPVTNRCRHYHGLHDVNRISFRVILAIDAYNCSYDRSDF